MIDVSVIITCYNEEEYIGAAIESVVQQTRHDAIKEVVVVDDGSEDNSEEIIQDWEKRSDKIRYMRQENQGLPAARNTGLKRSSGSFIALLDGDDIWLKERLEHQLRFARRHPDVGIIYSDAYLFGKDREGKRRVYCNRYEYSEEDVLRRLFVEGGPIYPSTTLINRECFRTVGLFDASLRRSQDADFWLRVASTYPIQHVKKPLVLKRDRDDSLGADVKKKAQYTLYVVDKIADLYSELDPLRRRRKAKVYSGLARTRTLSGKRKGALKAAFRAIRYDPCSLEHYRSLVFSLLPSRPCQLQRLRKFIKKRRRSWNNI